MDHKEIVKEENNNKDAGVEHIEENKKENEHESHEDNHNEKEHEAKVEDGNQEMDLGEPQTIPMPEVEYQKEEEKTGIHRELPETES